jgi:ATP-dependent helicase/nuclease subunit A
VQELLKGLDDEQKKAVSLNANAVVAAGAGSGKTKVLASRYAWLVMEKNLKPEEILTLTFTNKAVNEMYSRIYRYLLEQGEARTKDALKNFHKARINTLDSFSKNIAKTAAPRYGISPDFKSDETALRDHAREAALCFILDHREASAIRTLLADHKIRTLAEEIFAGFVLKHSPISSPLKLAENLLVQKAEILRVWKLKSRQLMETTAHIVEELHTLAGLKKSINLTKSLGEILLQNPPPALPDITPLLERTLQQTEAAADKSRDEDLPAAAIRQGIKKIFDYYSSLVECKPPSNYGEVYVPLLESFRLLKGKNEDGLYHELESIANYALNYGFCLNMSGLIEKFQNNFNAKKRETGLLSFNDIAHLAVDALKEHPDIRKVYKDSLKMIMVDEFQDNNALQRDLIYLLAENRDRTDKGIAAPAELEKDRMFFVGDEKQSIYLFRGADVSVFRSLGKDLLGTGFKPETSLPLEHDRVELLYNYRSRPALIAAFNHIFEKIFLPADSDAPAYEAKYSCIKPPLIKDEDDEDSGNSACLAHFCFLNEEELPAGDTEGLKTQDLEAVFIAEKIRDMVRGKEKIPRRAQMGIEWTECAWDDFAVLQRSYRHQGKLEKYFREFGVPYKTDRPSGLFNEAPVQDLCSYLRLLVYPEDRIAYAALIRSPFTCLSDLSLAVCMLAAEKKLAVNENVKTPEPFDEENEPLIPEEDRELYRRARERYRYFREASRTFPVTELLAKLWYEEGYRCETLWPESAQADESLFDLFFSLASECDSRGKSLADFIEYLEDLMNREEKPDDKDIPGEGSGGVRITSIHKSKGLEFPVVFIFDSTNSGNLKSSAKLVNFHEKYGLILDIPQAEELPLGGNYFRKVFLDEEKAKNTAELRRLLYVAMTRAEYRLFLTFTLPRQIKPEKKEWDAAGEEFNRETINRRLIQLDERSEGKGDTFLKLLQGILPDCPPSLCSIETIPILSRAEISKRAAAESAKAKRRYGFSGKREAALAAIDAYEKAEILPVGKARPISYPASKLTGGRDQGFGIRDKGSGIRDQGHCPLVVSTKTQVPSPQSPVPIKLEPLLEKAALGPMDFGSLVHAVLESRFKGEPCLVSPGILSRMGEEKALQSLLDIAEAMADGFLSSELGIRCKASAYREPEFSIVTSVEMEGKPVAITGQIDLIFMEEDEVVVVDFKTDSLEQPEDHYAQLAAYYQAAADIFCKPVSVWLFYLRSGRAVNVSKEVKSIFPGGNIIHDWRGT